MSPASAPPDNPRPHFYGRRKGKKLRAARSDALDEVLPALKIDSSKPFEGIFDFPVRDVWMEIGFGNGEHLAAQALAHPGIGFIGCEPFVNGMAALLVDIKKNGIKNIRLWPDDARILMKLLPDGCLGRCYILNSDPWPKKKHAKRRFIQEETLDELHRLLKPGAELRLSSDHPVLIDWQLEKALSHGKFKWTAKSAQDWRDQPDGLESTRYQQKGAKQGRPTAFLNFKKEL